MDENTLIELNRRRWICYMKSILHETIDFMVLVDLIVHDDFERAIVPVIPMMIEGPQALLKAKEMIDKYLKIDPDRMYIFVTTAHYEETEHIRKDVPFWWGHEAILLDLKLLLKRKEERDDRQTKRNNRSFEALM